MSRGLFAALAGVVSAVVFMPAIAEAGDRHRGGGVSVTISSGGGYHRHSGHWRHHRQYHHHRQYSHRGPRVVYVAPRRYYAPPPRVVYAPPPTIIYADPPPVIATAPVYAPPVTMHRIPGGPVDLAQPYCREYNTTTIVNGQRVNSFGTACRQPDGSWQIIN